MLNNKSQADNHSQIEPQKLIETTSSPTCTKPMLVAGFVIEYSDRGFTRWLRGFNYEMPYITNNFDLAKRYRTKISAERDLKRAIVANIKWFDFGKIIPIG